MRQPIFVCVKSRPDIEAFVYHEEPNVIYINTACTRPGRGEIFRPVGILLRDVCKQKKRSRLFNLDHPWSIGDSNS